MADVWEQFQRAPAAMPQGSPLPAAPASNSPFTPSPTPQGLNTQDWRKAESGRIAEEEKLLREKGEGAMEFLPDAWRVHEKILSRGEPAIGPFQGADWYNHYARAPAAAILPGALGGDTAQKNLGTWNELGADLKRLTASNLKADYGARPTNVDVSLNAATFGGLQSADQKTAASILGERIKKSYETLQRNVDAGFINPEKIPADIITKGLQNGHLDPKRFSGHAQLLDEAKRRGLIP